MEKSSLFSNIKFIYSNSFKTSKGFKFYIILNFISSLALPILGSLMGALVVYVLTNNYDINDYLLALGVMIALMAIFEVMNIYSATKYSWASTFIRINDFWVKLSSKTLKLDYQEIEPKSKQKELGKAFEALSSNWVGIEGLLKETPVVMVNIVGILVYGTLTGIYAPYVLLILILMSITNILLALRADKILSKNREKINDAFDEMYYLTNDIADPKNGKDIRIFNMSSWFDKVFIFLSKKRIKAEQPIHITSLFSHLSNNVFLFIRDILAYSTLIAMVLNQAIDVSLFAFMIGIIAGFSTWLNAFTDSFFRLKLDSSQTTYYKEYLNKENSFNHGKGIDIESLSLPLSVEFKNVSFSYPENDNKIIDNLSFKLAPGEKFALVGQNGAGSYNPVKSFTIVV